nr:glycosyltransferase family 2 protein [Hyphomonas sp. Mor2]
MSRPAVSAIVVSFHTGPRLKECLYGLDADPDVSEIILVDNGNPEEMRAWVQGFAQGRPHMKVLSGHGNIGFGAGVNLGARIAHGPHLLVINPDAVLRWKSLPALQETAADLSAPWIIGGKIFDVMGREERGGRRKELTLSRALTQMIGWNTWTLERTSAPTGPIDMPVISGAFFLTSKDSFEALGGFDEQYFLHVEDVDLCRRCREAGGRVVHDPRAAVLHYGSTSDAPSQVVQAHKADSLARYFRTFAKGGLEKILVEVCVPFIRLGLWLRRS